MTGTRRAADSLGLQSLLRATELQQSGQTRTALPQLGYGLAFGGSARCAKRRHALSLPVPGTPLVFLCTACCENFLSTKLLHYTCMRF